MNEKSKHLHEYRRHLQQLGRSEGTIRQRVGDIARLERHIGSVLALTRSELTTYLEEHTGDWSPAYRKKVYISYGMYFKWAKKTELSSSNPAKRLPQVLVPRYLPKPVPEDVVLDAFETATTVECAMLCLGATQGLRRGEIAQAHPANRDGSMLRVTGKGSKDRVVPLDSMTLSFLLQLESEQGTDDYYFRGRFGGHIHPDTVYKWLKRHLGTDWSTHNLRHRAASNGLRETRDLRGVQDLLGHESLNTTQVYTYVSPEELQHIVDANSLRTKLVERRLEAILATQRHGGNREPTDERIVEAIQILGNFLAAENGQQEVSET